MKSNQKNDQYWLRHVCRLASRGLGLSSPNPSVGACIVRDHKCLGTGVHVQAGQAHAEPLAIAAAQANGHDLSNATIYISLAPCTKHGKTPPCCDAIIAAGIKRVVVALEDPFQEDAASILEAHGISYSSNQLPEIAKHIHGGFLKRMQTGLPRITGKWAMTVDGYIATSAQHSQWISSPEALAMSRRRRRIFDAIVVGAETLRHDDPQLLASANKYYQQTPLRVILSRTIPDFTDKRMLSSLERGSILCFYQNHNEHGLKAARELGVECQRSESIEDAMRQLAERGCNDVLVEGGSQIHHAFLSDRLYDRLEIYIGAKTIAGGQAVAGSHGVERIDLGSTWHLEQNPVAMGSCVVLRYKLDH